MIKKLQEYGYELTIIKSEANQFSGEKYIIQENKGIYYGAQETHHK